jgi:hypothetical protein
VAVTFDAVGPSSTDASTAGTSPLTWSHTNGATADWLLAGVVLDGGAPGTNPITAMTYNAVTFGTALLNWQSGGSAQTVGYLAVYGLQNPATGAADTVSASITGTTIDTYRGGSASFVTGGGSLGTPQHFDSGGAAVASASLTIATTSASSLVVVFMTNGSGGTTWTAGTSRIVSSNNSGGTGAANTLNAATIAGTGGNVTVSWTQTSDFYAAIAVEVLPGAAPPRSGPALPQQFMGQRSVTVVSNAGWRGAQHSR